MLTTLEMPRINPNPRIALHQLLGKGGWGEVYRASSGGREVALKVLASEQITETDRLRFAREFQVMRHLHHPALVQPLDWGEFAGRLYYTMDLVEGQDFLSYVGEHPEQLNGLLIQLLEALSAIHAQGFIHRDLKPANLLVEKDGRLRVLDFGLARHVDDPTHMTRTGSILGTPAYMSPEQIRGERLDARSDLYAVGVLAYEAVTGVTPHHAEEVETVLYKILWEQAPELPAVADESLRCLVSWLMQKDPELRPRSAEQAVRKLRGELPPCPKSQRRLRLPKGNWTAFLAGLGVGLATWLV